MTEYVWSDLRDALVIRWSDIPSADLEQRVLDVWERHPQLVTDAWEQIDERYARGVVRSPWAVLAKHVEEAAVIAERSSKAVTDDVDRTKAQQRGARWVRSTGIHFDRESEVRDELFGDFGMLRAYRNDDELVDALLTLWESERPRGERTEREAEERMTRQGAAYHAQHAVDHGREHPTGSEDAAPQRGDLVGAAPALPNPFLDE